MLELLPRTAIWIALLPTPVRPNALAAQFARIANLVCAVWGDPLACRKYLRELLTDERGGRKGFPTAALREIETLQAYHAHMHRSSRALDWSGSNPVWDELDFADPGPTVVVGK